MLDRQIRFLLDNFDRTGAPIQSGALKRLEDLDATWQQYKQDLSVLFDEDIAPLNKTLQEQGLNGLDKLN